VGHSWDIRESQSYLKEDLKVLYLREPSLHLTFGFSAVTGLQVIDWLKDKWDFSHHSGGKISMPKA
jgi:hypothetical protein